MKTTFALTFSLLALLPVKMLADGSATLNGALIGGVAGAIIGNNSGHHDGFRGALIGSAAGALIGSAVDDSRGYHGYGYSGRSHVSVSYGVGYGHYPYHGYRPYYGGYRHSQSGWGYPSFYYSYSSPVYYEDSRPVQVVAAPETPVAAAPAQPAQSTPQNVTIINNYYGNSSQMSAANSAFGR